MLAFNGTLAAMLVWLLSDLMVSNWKEMLLVAFHLLLAGALIAGIYADFQQEVRRKAWNLISQSLVALYPATFFFGILFMAERIDGIEAMLLVVSFWLFVGVAVTWWLYRRTEPVS